MRKYNNDKYENIVVCGSYRKYKNGIDDCVNLFVSNGFHVLSPSTEEVIDPTAEFVMFLSDVGKDINTIENDHIRKMLEADVVYFYNPKGYIGFSSGLELGYILAKGQEAYFLEEPTEEILKNYAKGKIEKPDEFVRMLRVSNETWNSREYWDADLHRKREFEL